LGVQEIDERVTAQKEWLHGAPFQRKDGWEECPNCNHIKII
jgi:hypothetical protein